MAASPRPTGGFSGAGGIVLAAPGSSGSARPTGGFSGAGGSAPAPGAAESPFAELPALPAPPAYALRALERGTQAVDRADLIPALWRAHGMPATLGFAGRGAAAAGVRGIVLAAPGSGAAVVAAATGLNERGGRLYGRIAIESAGLPAAAAALAFERWYPAADYAAVKGQADGNGTNGRRRQLVPIALTFASAGGQRVTVAYTARGAGAASGDDTYVRWDGARKVVESGEGFPIPPVVVRTDGLPFAGDAGAQFAFQAAVGIDLVLRAGAVTAQRDVLFSAVRQAPLRPVAPPALAASLPMAWRGGAEIWSRGGSWVRRLSWLDRAQMVRHEAGAGTARAVLVLLSSAVATKRVVRNSELTAADILARDWVLTYPPDDGEMDLTDSRLSIATGPSGSEWMLFASNQGGPAPGGGVIAGPGPGPGSGGAGHDGCDCCACP